MAILATYCFKEVILAAGVFNTPKLLELSGIGKEDILNRHGIKVNINLPRIGENIQDHLMTGVSYEIADGVATGDPLMRQEPDALQSAQKLYTEQQKGPFTVGGIQSHDLMFTPGTDGTELVSKHVTETGDVDRTEILRSILGTPGQSTAAWFLFLAQDNLHEGAKSFVGNHLMPEKFASFGCSQSYPMSRGSSHISFADINAIPEIGPRYFSHPLDLEIRLSIWNASGWLRFPSGLKKSCISFVLCSFPGPAYVEPLRGSKTT